MFGIGVIRTIPSEGSAGNNTFILGTVAGIYTMGDEVAAIRKVLLTCSGFDEENARAEI
jgi:hypothetical protein